MNKIQLFSKKATYASPSSKLIILQGRQCIMQGSIYDPDQHTEKYIFDDDEDL